MEPEILQSIQCLVGKAIKMVAADESNIDELNDVIEDIADLDDEVDDLKGHLQALSEALENEDKVILGRSIMMVRASCMNISGSYSNLVEFMSSVVSDINDQVIAENEKKFALLPIAELVQKNLNCEIGSFVYDLQYRGDFNEVKFLYLVESIENNFSSLDFFVLFELYVTISNKIIYNADADDGYKISNLSVHELQHRLKKLEEVIGQGVRAA